MKIRPVGAQLFHATRRVGGYAGRYRGSDKASARPTSPCILFDGKNISFDDILVIYINSTNTPPIMPIPVAARSKA